MIDSLIYQSWIEARPNIQLLDSKKPLFSTKYWNLIIKYGIPQKIYSFLFMGAGEFFGRLLNELAFTENNSYIKNINENKRMICQHLGRYIWLDEKTGCIELFTQDTGKIDFVNESFDEFFEFLSEFAKMVHKVESNNALDCDIASIKYVELEEFENVLKSIASNDWDKYIFWKKLIQGIVFVKKIARSTD